MLLVFSQVKRKREIFLIKDVLQNLILYRQFWRSYI